MFRAVVTAGKIRFLLLACVGATLAWGVAPALSLSPTRRSRPTSRQPVPDVQRDRRSAAAARDAARPRGREGRCASSPRVDRGPGAASTSSGSSASCDPVEYRARPEGGEWSGLGRDRQRRPRLLRRRRRASAAQPRRAPRGRAPLRERQRDRDAREQLLTGVREAVNSAFISVAATPIAGAQPPQPRDHDPRRRGARDGGCEPRDERLLRRGQGGDRPPHRDRERLLGRGGAGHRARDLPLPPQRKRLERHRLQLPRRPLRHDLRGPRGRDRRGGRRRPRPGLQLADVRRPPRSAPTRASASPSRPSRRSPS